MIQSTAKLNEKLKTSISGKEDEDGYPSQELVIYGSSRSSPRSHSAVGGNFDPQVFIIHHRKILIIHIMIAMIM